LDDAPLCGDARCVSVPDSPPDERVATHNEGQGQGVAEEEDGAQEKLTTLFCPRPCLQPEKKQLKNIEYYFILYRV
jgi:hypothetical protein